MDEVGWRMSLLVTMIVGWRCPGYGWFADSGRGSASRGNAAVAPDCPRRPCQEGSTPAGLRLTARGTFLAGGGENSPQGPGRSAVRAEICSLPCPPPRSQLPFRQDSRLCPHPPLVAPRRPGLELRQCCPNPAPQTMGDNAGEGDQHHGTRHVARPCCSHPLPELSLKGSVKLPVEGFAERCTERCTERFAERFAEPFAEPFSECSFDFSFGSAGHTPLAC